METPVCKIWLGIWNLNWPLSPLPFVIFMDRISRCSCGEEGIWFGKLRVTSLLFADDVVLLASSSQDLHGALEGFPAKYEVARIKVNTSREIHRRIRASSALMKAQLRSVCKSQEEKLWLLFVRVHQTTFLTKKAKQLDKTFTPHRQTRKLLCV